MDTGNPEGRLQADTVLYGGDQKAAEALADAILIGRELSQGDRGQLSELVRNRGWQPLTDEECAALRDRMIANFVLSTCRTWKREAAVEYVRNLFEPERRPARSTVFDILKREKPKMPWLETVNSAFALIEELKELTGAQEVTEIMPRIREELLLAESAE